MKCEECGLEIMIHRVLKDGTYIYTCRNPQCIEYKKLKTSLGEEISDVGGLKNPSGANNS